MTMCEHPTKKSWMNGQWTTVPGKCPFVAVEVVDNKLVCKRHTKSIRYHIEQESRKRANVLEQLDKIPNLEIREKSRILDLLVPRIEKWRA